MIEIKSDDPEVFEALHDALAEIEANSVETLPITASESEKRAWMMRQMAADTTALRCMCGKVFVYSRMMALSRWDDPLGITKFSVLDCLCGNSCSFPARTSR